MTNEEAIEMFKAIIMAEIDRLPYRYDAEVGENVYNITSRVNEILQLNKIVSKALKKQIPEIPHLVYDAWICPSCGRYYEIDYDHYVYCPQCGQRINWSTLE